MSRYTVTELQGSYRIEDNEAQHDAPGRVLDVTFTAPGEAQAHARRLNRENDEQSEEAESP